MRTSWTLTRRLSGAYLIYIYRYRVASPKPDRAELTPDNLMLPPVFINKMPWTKGYFENVDCVDIAEKDILSRYCFWDGGREIYVDENRNEFPREFQPCGDWGLSGYRWLDDQISDALGIPRVPRPTDARVEQILRPGARR